MDEEFLRKLQHTLEKHLSNPEFSVERLARLLSMGRATLYRKILALTGETPVQLIRSYRLQRAMQLLKARAGNVSEISSMVGYTSSIYFSYCYKSKFHISPSEVLRNSLKNLDENTTNGIESDPPNITSIKETNSINGKPCISHPPSSTLLASNSCFSQSMKRRKELILVIEDNPDMCDYFKKKLKTHYCVNIVHDSLQGFKYAQNQTPDVIISEVLMPGINEIELSQRLKSTGCTSHIPIIFLASPESEKKISKKFETGMYDYITKPFKLKTLLACIRNILMAQKHHQEVRKEQLQIVPDEISIPSVDEIFLKEVNQCLEKNISDFEFNVGMLAKELFIGRTTLYRKIVALTGKNPSQYICSYRLKKAAQLLKSQSSSIIDIAFGVGFSNSSYFTKCFKEMFHCLPSEFYTDQNE